MTQYEHFDNSKPSNDARPTKPDLWRPLADAVGGFDLDPASGCEPVQIAEEVYTEAENGLSQDWFGTVFLNPPFSEKAKWYKKAAAEVERGAVETIVALAPVDTSTDWFQDNFSTAPLICWLNGRRWYLVDGSPSFNTAVGVWGDCPPALRSTLAELGTVSITDLPESKQMRL